MTADPADLGDLVARAQASQAGALEALIVACHPQVVRIVRAHRSATLADEDLIQEVVLALIQRLARYQPRAGAAFHHWLYRLGVNVCLDRLRSEGVRQRGRVAPAAEWLAWLSDRRTQPPDDQVAAAETVDYLLAQLPPKDRLTLSLLDLEGHSLAEVSALTGWNTTMIKVRAFRARRRLRAWAERHGIDRTGTQHGQKGDHDPIR